jgi:tetratricopeptide (TPR) repeat protein
VAWVRALVVGGLFAATVAVTAGCLDEAAERRVRANAYLRGGDAAAALAECDRGLEKEARNVSLLILRGKALFELTRYREAEAAYLSALSALGAEGSKAGLGEAHLGLAMVYMRLDKYSEARAQFAELVELRPGDADARMNLARICLQLQDIECALEHGQAAGHVRGSDEGVLFTLGRIYVVAKRYDEADKTFRHICEVAPGASSCPYGQALVAAQRGDKARALAKLREAIELKLPHPDKLADDPLLSPLEGEAQFSELAASARQQ